MTTITRPALHELGVAEAAEAIARREISVVELNESLVARTAELEPSIKAFAYLDREAWIEDARRLDAELELGKSRGPLHGIPVGIKDQFLVGGAPCKIATTWGDPALQVDSTPVARLREAGAIIAGITYMPDRAGDPPTCNPWNLAHTPGGSSSGSAASVAARMVPIALGEQTGGSNNRPAAFCGVDALKPTYGRISRKGLYVISWSLDHPGIIGRSFEDIALVFNAVAGPDVLDPTSRPERLAPVSLPFASMRPPRIGFIRNHFPENLDGSMAAAMESAASRLAEAGADLVDLRVHEDFGAVGPAWKFVATCERVTFHARRGAALATSGVEVKPEVESLIPASYYLQAQRIRRFLLEATMPLFAEVDYLYTPAALGPAPLGHGGGDNSMNLPWAALGLPTIAFNIGMDPEGLPLGGQLTAPHLEEDALLAAGAWVEGVLGRTGMPAFVPDPTA